jgi:hypothetical protein
MPSSTWACKQDAGKLCRLREHFPTQSSGQWRGPVHHTPGSLSDLCLSPAGQAKAPAQGILRNPRKTGRVMRCITAFSCGNIHRMWGFPCEILAVSLRCWRQCRPPIIPGPIAFIASNRPKFAHRCALSAAKPANRRSTTPWPTTWPLPTGHPIDGACRLQIHTGNVATSRGPRQAPSDGF